MSGNAELRLRCEPTWRVSLFGPRSPAGPEQPKRAKLHSPAEGVRPPSKLLSSRCGRRPASTRSGVLGSLVVGDRILHGYRIQRTNESGRLDPVDSRRFSCTCGIVRGSRHRERRNRRGISITRVETPRPLSVIADLLPAERCLHGALHEPLHRSDRVLRGDQQYQAENADARRRVCRPPEPRPTGPDQGDDDASNGHEDSVQNAEQGQRHAVPGARDRRPNHGPAEPDVAGGGCSSDDAPGRPAVRARDHCATRLGIGQLLAAPRAGHSHPGLVSQCEDRRRANARTAGT